ncbi:DUF5677 domain-containing protein [Photobacterium sanguinicancri]|uniref:DUF5677 domain-containing protein n=1 Tax=Photobacterium sanguinicancri TaxID=875932 RepID=UPI0026E2046B|nr:DUF5677 domain-containing protein [Photobacterium sanguinicancri]MDO6496962.1 DUF5677 domain-containing protein [Photobacterium sanguinicancri]
MKEIIQDIVKNTLRKEQHAAHIEVIKEVFDDLECLYGTLDIETGDGIKYRLQRSQLRFMLEALSKMQASIITLLSSKLYEGVDPLVRVVMEHAVNVMYIAESKENERPKQLIKHYIETTAENSKHWLKSAIASGDEVAIELAQKKVEHLKILKQGHLSLYERSVGKWPNPFRRFEALELVDEYATLYSMNSDSIHSLSEDIFNFCTLESYPEELKHYAFRNFQALNISMSVYLGMKSVLFYALALDKVLTLLGRDDDVFQILSKLNQVALEHEDENFARWS